MLSPRTRTATVELLAPCGRSTSSRPPPFSWSSMAKICAPAPTMPTRGTVLVSGARMSDTFTSRAPASSVSHSTVRARVPASSLPTCWPVVPIASASFAWLQRLAFRNSWIRLGAIFLLYTKMVDLIEPKWLTNKNHFGSFVCMKLHDWMAGVAKTPEELAKIIGVTGEAVRRYRSGARMPRPEIVKRIQEVTGGQVTAHDLHEQRIAFLASQAVAA